MSKAIVKQFNYASSCIAYNNGNTNFTIEKLPVTAQLSCINAISVMDVNNDNKPDIIIGSNQFGFLPQYEKLDAGFGDILLNSGKKNFEVVDARQTGFNIRGEVRDMIQLNSKKDKRLLILQNNQYPLLFSLQTKIK